MSFACIASVGGAQELCVFVCVGMVGSRNIRASLYKANGSGEQADGGAIEFSTWGHKCCRQPKLMLSRSPHGLTIIILSTPSTPLIVRAQGLATVPARMPLSSFAWSVFWLVNITIPTHPSMHGPYFDVLQVLPGQRSLPYAGFSNCTPTATVSSTSSSSTTATVSSSSSSRCDALSTM